MAKNEIWELCHSRGACLHPNFCLDYVVSSQQLFSSAGLLHTVQMFLLLLLHGDFSSSSIDRYFQMCAPFLLDRPFLLTKSRSPCCSGFWSIDYRESKQYSIDVVFGVGDTLAIAHTVSVLSTLWNNTGRCFPWTSPPNSFYSHPSSSSRGRMDYVVQT